MSSTLRRHKAALMELVEERDRKSTRLNSSHANISYAVFCLKKTINALSLQSLAHPIFHTPLPFLPPTTVLRLSSYLLPPILRLLDQSHLGRAPLYPPFTLYS